jgi:hypothetical protein
MLITRADLPAGFQAQPATGDDPHTDCAPGVSEADLTLTGKAEGKQFAAASAALGVALVGSAAQVYASRADAAASWRRATSASGVQCATALLRSEFAKQGIRLVSLRRTPFPNVSERTVAYRVTLSSRTPQGAVPVYVDLIALMRSRAHATVIVGRAVVAPVRADELRLARLLATRMTKAMRTA